MPNSRDRILQTLLNHPRSTINQLAEAALINTISVRHHLASLQAEGLLHVEEERHGVGRPRLVYTLTEKGIEKFPTRYLRLTNHILEQLKDSIPPQEYKTFFTKIAEKIAEDYADKVKDMPTEERLDLIRMLLAEEGFTMQWEKKDDQYHIHEITCPYYRIGQTHPEVCAVDQTLISTILAIPAEKIECLLQGGNQCTFRIPDIPTREVVS